MKVGWDCPICRDNNGKWEESAFEKTEIGIGDIKVLICVSCGYIAQFRKGKHSLFKGGDKRDEW